jgi:hypothetical protein
VRQLAAVAPELYIPRFIDHPLCQLQLNERTTVIFSRSRLVGAFIHIIIYAVTVRIRNGATMVAGRTGYCLARIFFVIHAIMICVRYGTTVITGNAWNEFT